MAKKIADWLTREGLALIAGRRRQGDTPAQIAEMMGVSLARLRKLSKEHEEMRLVLQIDKDVADFLVEDVLFNKSLSGDAKAYEFWLKHRMPEKWGKAAPQNPEKREDGYARLSELINNPVAREEDFE